MVLAGRQTDVEVLGDQPSQTRTLGPCLSPQEVSELVLVLRVGRALWLMRPDHDGDARRVVVLAGAQVAAGSISRWSSTGRQPASNLLTRRQVLETLRRGTRVALVERAVSAPPGSHDRLARWEAQG